MDFVGKDDCFCQNRDRFPTVLGPNHRIVDGANGHLASVFGPIASYKEKDLRLYTKLGKLSCEKGKVVVHDEELRDSDRSLTFSGTAAIFSSERAFQRCRVVV